MLISPVKAKHYYSFSSISVSRLTSIFQALLIFSSKFLREASVLFRFGISLKVNILRTLSKISSAVFMTRGCEENPAIPICSGCSFSALITQEQLTLGNLNSACFIDLSDEGENSSCLKKINSIFLELGAIRVEGQILLWITAVRPPWNASLRADSSWHILYIFIKKFVFFLEC